MRRMKRIMYIENKENGLSGQARIGWVELSHSIGLFRSARFNSRSYWRTGAGSNSLTARRQANAER
jgi:hypothetical protein